MRKTGAALITALLVTAAAGTIFVELGWANPYSQAVYKGETSYVPNTQPPAIQISSPTNNQTYNADNIDLTFKASVGNSTAPIGRWTDRGMWISAIYYKADWQENGSVVYSKGDNPMVTDFSHSVNLTGIPDGKHYIIVTATEAGTYFPDIFSYYGFSINGSSLATFTIDTAPNVSFLPFENSTFETSSVPLKFTVSQVFSKITYCLDGQSNVTISGNTTLTGLPNGYHNLTVYAWDASGNVGASETVSFTVAEPESFPTVPVAAVSAASITAVACAGLILTRRKRRKEATQI